MSYGLTESQGEQLKAWVGSGSINIFGTPWAGKDTQGKRLAEFFDAPLIGGGDIIRSGDDQELKAAIAGGKLAPTDAYLATVTPYLSRPEFTGKPIILSSVGRWIGEEQVIMEAASRSGHAQKAVVFLNLPEAEIHKRWEAAQESKDRGEREDDAIEALEVRLDEFRNKTKPVIDFYREKGLLVEVDGAKTPDKVTASIFEALLAKAL
jgi:adenylate kinase